MKSIYETTKEDLILDDNLSLQTQMGLSKYVAFYPNGQKKFQVLFDLIFSNGNVTPQPRSIFICYRPSGMLLAKFFTVNNNKVGYYHFYDPLGKIKEQTFEKLQTNRT